MSNYFFLVVLPNIGCFFTILSVLGISVSIAGSIIFLAIIDDDADRKKMSNFFKSIFKIFVVSVSLLFITCFIPEQKQIIQLRAIDIVSDLKGVDQIPQKLIDRLNSLLEAEKKND